MAITRSTLQHADTLVPNGGHFSRPGVDCGVALRFLLWPLIISYIFVEQTTLFKWPTRTHFQSKPHDNDISPSLENTLSYRLINIAASNNDRGHSTYIENNVCNQVTNCFSAHERVIFVFISWVMKTTLKWAQKQFVIRVHTLFYFLHNITNP